MRTKTKRSGAMVALCAMSVTGCGFGEEVPMESLWTEGLGPRNLVEQPLREAWKVGGEADTLILNPGILRAREDGLVFFDYAEHRVVALDGGGRPAWFFGREGEGPGEFAMVRGVHVLADQGVLLYDEGNGRTTRLSERGALVEELRLPVGVGQGEGAVQVAGGVALVTFAPEKPFVVVRGGRIESRSEMPWLPFSRMRALDRQGGLVSDGADWAYLFSYGNGWFPFRGTQPLDYLGRYVEHVDFPRLVTTSTASTRTTTFSGPPVLAMRSAALSDGTLYVHFAGTSDDRYRIVDRYRFETGEYLDSFVLPVAFKQITVGHGRLYGLRDVPWPEITAFDIVSGADGGGDAPAPAAGG